MRVQTTPTYIVAAVSALIAAITLAATTGANATGAALSINATVALQGHYRVMSIRH